jgi:hypothetical protein
MASRTRVTRCRAAGCRTALAAASALIAGSLLTACTQGNFGEVRPSLVRDDIHDWMGAAAVDTRDVTGSIQVSHFQFTDDERLLRDLGYPLIEPPYDRKHWDSVLGEYGMRGYNRDNRMPREAYAEKLLGEGYRSPTARYQKLIEDIRNDLTRLPAFYETATRVSTIDEKRKRALDFTRSPPPERTGALARIRENNNIVAWVTQSLNDRFVGYRYALERLVVMTPSPLAVEVETGLRSLRAAIDARGQSFAPVARVRYFPVSK